MWPGWVTRQKSKQSTSIKLKVKAISICPSLSLWPMTLTACFLSSQDIIFQEPPSSSFPTCSHSSDCTAPPHSCLLRLQPRSHLSNLTAPQSLINLELYMPVHFLCFSSDYLLVFLFQFPRLFQVFLLPALYPVSWPLFLSAIFFTSACKPAFCIIKASSVNPPVWEFAFEFNLSVLIPALP